MLEKVVARPLLSVPKAEVKIFLIFGDCLRRLMAHHLFCAGLHANLPNKTTAQSKQDSFMR